MWMALVRTGMHVCAGKKRKYWERALPGTVCTWSLYLQPWERSFFWRPMVSRTMHDSAINLPSQICQCRQPLVFAVPMHPFRIELMTRGKYRRLGFSMDANYQFYKSSYGDRADRDMEPPTRCHLHPIESTKMDSRRRASRDCCHGIHSICTTDEEKIWLKMYSERQFDELTNL